MDEQLGQPLDGLELDYTYEGGGQIIASFSHGRLKYRWLSGPFEGVEESGLNYQSRHVRDEIYLVNWHDKDNSNFVTLNSGACIRQTALPALRVNRVAVRCIGAWQRRVVAQVSGRAVTWRSAGAGTRPRAGGVCGRSTEVRPQRWRWNGETIQLS